MPELPEVELLRRGLSHYVVGLTIAALEVRTAKVFTGDAKRLIGAAVAGVRRFGKMLAIDFSNGLSLAVHVKMTGRLIYRGAKQPKRLSVDPEIDELPNKHTHVIFSFTNGDRLYYNDTRKFGWLKVVRTVAIMDLPFVKQLGPEPFRDLNERRFTQIVGKSTRPIKTLLMDQGRISGVGNIYANEALFCAAISPKRLSNRLSESEIRHLYGCVLRVLEQGVQYGGSSTDAFRDVLGQKGAYQEHYLVYDREGEPCRRQGCRGTIGKLRMGGRGTYWCPVCQK